MKNKFTEHSIFVKGILQTLNSAGYRRHGFVHTIFEIFIAKMDEYYFYIQDLERENDQLKKDIKETQQFENTHA